MNAVEREMLRCGVLFSEQHIYSYQPNQLFHQCKCIESLPMHVNKLNNKSTDTGESILCGHKYLS